MAKTDGLGSTLLWATYLGGETNLDTVWGIAVDNAHAVYVAGQTSSSDYPTTAGAFSQMKTPSGNGFVTKLLPNASGLVWSTYLSSCCNGSGHEWALAVDVAGNAFSIGSANEKNFPVTPDAYQSTCVCNGFAGDTHFTKWDAFGTTLLYSTWIGGNDSDYFPEIALDAAQDPHIAIQSYSSNMPTTAGAYDTTPNGDLDIVVAKFDLMPQPWIVLGGGKAGTSDVPNLAGGGVLVPGTPMKLAIRGAAKNAGALLFAGLNLLNAPAFGGTFVPSPDIVLPLVTDTSGGIDINVLWPSAPAGVPLYLQVWIADPGATLGCSATNALELTSQ